MSWESDTLEKAVNKYRATIPSAREISGVPYYGGASWRAHEDGEGWWTNGFWPGICWLLYAYQKDERYALEARRVQEKLLIQMHGYYNNSHDLGFLYLLSCGADAKLTENRDALRETLMAATLLAGRFNPAGFIRAWNGEGQEGWAIVDCMMNLPLLYAASALTRDPRFAAVARVSADTTAREFIRADGSCNHIVCFDPIRGHKLSTPAGQGCFGGSAWSRGQAWALYGFALMYMNTGDPRDRTAACRVADYFVAHIRADGLVPCDFMQPESEDLIDNIASACAACGLIELGRQTQRADYQAAALRLLHALDDTCADYRPDTRGILTRCTAAYRCRDAEREKRLIYGDYFYIEALEKLCGCDPMLWRV